MLLAARKLTRMSDTRLRVWLAASCDDATFSPAAVTAEYKLPASMAAGRHCAGLTYSNQYAAGGSFVASLEGQIIPAYADTELLIRIGVPRIPETPQAETELLDAIVAGIRELPPERRPIGTLELTRFRVHPADFKTQRWKIAATLLCHLMSAEMASLLDRNANEGELWAAFERGCPQFKE